MSKGKKKADPCMYEVRIEEEDIPFVGNCMASGDDATDRETEDWIRKELASGNEYAWCCAIVTARFENYSATDSLGAISCKGQQDFEESILPGMKDEARARLRNAMEYRAGKAVKDAQVEARNAKAALKRFDCEG